MSQRKKCVSWALLELKWSEEFLIQWILNLLFLLLRMHDQNLRSLRSQILDFHFECRRFDRLQPDTDRSTHTHIYTYVHIYIHTLKHLSVNHKVHWILNQSVHYSVNQTQSIDNTKKKEEENSRKKRKRFYQQGLLVFRPKLCFLFRNNSSASLNSVDLDLLPMRWWSGVLLCNGKRRYRSRWLSLMRLDLRSEDSSLDCFNGFPVFDEMTFQGQSCSPFVSELFVNGA